MANKKVTTVKYNSLKKHQENPFMNDALESINKNIVKKYKSSTNTDQKATLLAYDENTGQVLGHTRFIRQIEVDEDKFAKLYLANFQAFFDLSRRGIRVFGYILTCMKPAKDMIYFDMSDCLEYTTYKAPKDVYRGLTELITSEIIARGKNPNLFFINPMMFFNGDRVTFAKTFVLSKTGAKTPLEAQKKQLDVIDQAPTQLPFVDD